MSDLTTHQGEHPSFGELTTYVQTLLMSKEIKEKPPEDQGNAILDGFIGVLVRRGPVMTSNGVEQSAGDVLRIMQTAAHEMVDDRVATPSGDPLWQITRQDGRRDAVWSLLSDERVLRAAITGVLDRVYIRRGSRGAQEITLLNREQLAAYLGADTPRAEDKSIETWRPGLLEEVERMLKYGIDESRPSSNNGFLIREGQRAQRAFSEAEKDGVDKGLVVRSVERIRYTAGWNEGYSGGLGRSAVSSAVEAATRAIQLGRLFSPE